MARLSKRSSSRRTPTRRQFVKLPKVLLPGDVTIVIDTREQQPYLFPACNTIIAGLETGDYSIAGMEEFVSVERKSLQDFIACCGRERERFKKELKRLHMIKHCMIVLEAGYEQIMAGTWPGCITPDHVVSSIASWTARFCPIALAGNRIHANDFTQRFLMAVARFYQTQGRIFAQ